MSPIGKKIKDFRKSAGLSQTELAARAGVLQKDISRWESGTHCPNTETLGKLCKALNVSTDAIIYEENQISLFDLGRKYNEKNIV